MIGLTRLNKKRFVVNAELIKFIEKTPDTMITLVNGEHFMVLEAVDEIVDKAVEYAKQIKIALGKPGRTEVSDRELEVAAKLRYWEAA